MPYPPLVQARCFDPREYLPLTTADGQRIGWVQRGSEAEFAKHPSAFTVLESQVSVRSALQLERAVEALAASGWIRGWRAERYPVPGTDWTLERAAFRRLGLPTRAVHLNGWTRAEGRTRLWVARRSPAKAIDPGLLDNIVGGGIPAGLSVLDTLGKECAEEASIPVPLAARAQPGSVLRTRRSVPDGVHDEEIHVFDLELPAGFEPRNADGEVADFELCTLEEVAARIAGGRYTVDAGLATLDFLWRSGALRDPAVGEALAGLATAP